MKWSRIRAQDPRKGVSVREVVVLVRGRCLAPQKVRTLGWWGWGKDEGQRLQVSEKRSPKARDRRIRTKMARSSG